MNPHGALDALVCGYASLIRARKTLVFLEWEAISADGTHQVFVDESGGSTPDRILLLSACIDTYDNWIAFSDAWYAALQESPSISGFHVREARQREGEFVGWKAIDVDLKVIRLTEVLLSYRPHIVSVWVSEKDYDEIIRPNGVPDIKYAYFMCFQAVILKVADYQALRGIATQADFIFDDKGDIGLEALLWYPAIKDGCKPEVEKILGGTPIFRDDKNVLPLQAADLIAWHKRRQKEFGYLDPETAASMRIDELPGGELELTKESLRKMAANMSKVPGIEDAQSYPSGYKQLKSEARKAIRRRQSGIHEKQS